MFNTLFIKEIQQLLYSFRFQVSLIIVLLVFVIGSIAFIRLYSEEKADYFEYHKEHLKNLEEQAKNASDLATHRKNYVLEPRSNSIISDCKENMFPNQFIYSAYNVFNLEVRHDNVNPLLKPVQSLNWSFIVSFCMSFLALLFAFDTISGEKEDHTLSLALSNPVSRGTVLWAKYAAILSVITVTTIFGILISILIIGISGKIQINTGFLSEATGFVIITFLLIALVTVFGLFSSVISRNSNVSLLVSLCFWLFFAIIIPNTSVFWANKLFPIEHRNEVEAKIQLGYDDLCKNAPPRSWSSSGDPFYDRHKLRADLQMKLMENEKKFILNYINEMFHQFEKTRKFTLLSPIAQFDNLNEVDLGGGYLRLKKNWNDLQNYQSQFLTWFKTFDAKDPKSPHWYNPNESYSTTWKSVPIEEVPVYIEKPIPFATRISQGEIYIALLLVYTTIIFFVSFILFVKYDVR
ncbi:MAG TPA: ABC transporter permease subunit [Bacteroidales bacterium]|nr:ABC transporter permease subunit [Bacteroidales bacterium]